MAIQIQCLCTWQGRVRSNLAGCRVRCPDCRGVIEVPQVAETSEKPAKRPPSTAPLTSQQQRAGSENTIEAARKTGKRSSRTENPFLHASPPSTANDDSMKWESVDFDTALAEQDVLQPVSAGPQSPHRRVHCTPVCRLLRWGLESFLLLVASLPLLITWGVLSAIPFLENSLQDIKQAQRNRNVDSPSAASNLPDLRNAGVAGPHSRAHFPTDFSRGQPIEKKRSVGLTGFGWYCIAAAPIAALLAANWYLMQRGQTVARFLMGITVIATQTGQPIGVAGMLQRMLIPLAVFIVTLGAAQPILLIDQVMAFRSNRRRLLDDLLKTSVVHP